MRIAYKDRAGGAWKVWTRYGVNTPIDVQMQELEGLGNVIIGTVRGRRIKRRAIRGM